MDKLLTIVVPVYKVEPYINKCLDSLVMEDESLMNQLEVIVVNDGTPDRSAEMSREYVKRFPNTFRQIDKENGGHGSAWNFGLKEATGKYLRFLDSDDWLTDLDRLLCKLQESDADLVLTNDCAHFFDKDKETKVEIRACGKIYEKILNLEECELLDVVSDYSSVNFRRCTYKTSVLQKQVPLFRERVSYDDTILFAAPLLLSRTIVAYDFTVYHFLRGREDQSMNASVIRKKADQYLFAYLDLHKYITGHVFSGNVRATLRLAEHGVYAWCFHVISQVGYRRQKELMKEWLANAPDNYQYTKQMRRYKEKPFLVAYLWDQLRYLKMRATGLK